MIPETMTAAVLTGHGGPEKLVLRDDWPVPVPGPGEVLVEVGACGINNTDIWVREGAYGSPTDPDAVGHWRSQPMTFPRIQGADTVGRIVAVGPDVDGARVGQRVMVDFGLYGPEGEGLVDIGYIGSERDGGFAEYTAVPAENAYPVDTPLTDAELATFCCAYVTGERMLERARLAAGETVVVTGASGGVGSGLIQLAHARGARVVAVTGPGKAAAVAGLGPEAVVTRDAPDLAAAVAEATGGRPVDVVADLVAGPLFNDLLRLLRPLGRYVTAGAIAGPVVQLDLRTLYLKHLEAIGSTQGTRHNFRTVLGHVLAGRIKPLLAATYPLADIHRAQADFKAKDFFGKLVIQVREG